MTEDYSPEEKLLRLIRSKVKKKAEPEAKKENVNVAGELVEASSKKKAKPAKKPLIRKGFPGSGGAAPGVKANVLTLENLNIVLVIILFGALLYFIPLFFRTPVNVLDELDQKVKRQTALSRREPVKTKRPSFEEFSKEVGTRNVFQPVIQEITDDAPVDQGPTLDDIKAQLNLLGIVWGEDPQAIIENKTTQKTYFLYKGEGFENIELQEILENKVKLQYKGKQFELVI